MGAKRRTYTTTLVLLCVGFGSVMLTSSGRNVRPERWLSGAAGFVQRGVAEVGQAVGNTLRSVGELRRLRRDYEALLEQLDGAERLQVRIDQLERENDRLREQLGFASRVEQQAVAARVIAKEDGPLFRSISINRGARHGITVDQAVVAISGGREGFVGRVAQVSGGTAIVQPVFSRGSFVAARLERSRHEGLLRGVGTSADSLELQYVPEAARTEIRYDDLVVTSGFDSLFPPGLPLGLVRHVVAEQYTSSLTVMLEPVVDFDRLEYVFVLVTATIAGRSE